MCVCGWTDGERYKRSDGRVQGGGRDQCPAGLFLVPSLKQHRSVVNSNLEKMGGRMYIYVCVCRWSAMILQSLSVIWLPVMRSHSF